MNPYTQPAGERAEAAATTLDALQSTDRNPDFDHHRDSDSFTKADTDRHA